MSGGSAVEQIGITAGHRVWKRHPGGGAAGLGTSPWRTIRSRLRSGSGIGIAERSAWVYGCIGREKSGSVGARSTTFPRYITTTLWLIERTTERWWEMNR